MDSVVKLSIPSLLALLVLSAQLCQTAPNPATEGEDHTQAQPRTVGLSARLDKLEICPGEVARLTETIPLEKVVMVTGTGHAVYRIGDYDPKLDKMTNREPERYLHQATSSIFEGLPSAESGSGLKEFTVRNPREIGFEFECKAKKVGIYLIVPNWGERGKKSFLYGPPVVLLIKPPKDQQGRTIMKEEWIP